MLLPSQFQPGDLCLVLGKFGGQITKVSFTKSKVLYDVEIGPLPGMVTRLHSVDSVFVEALKMSANPETQE